MVAREGEGRLGMRSTLEGKEELMLMRLGSYRPDAYDY